jgi:hypothetical protein
MLGLWKYSVAIIGLLILVMITLRASYILKISLKHNGYLFTISTVCLLLVIGTYEITG